MKKKILRQEALDEMLSQCIPLTSNGATASYIPQLQSADPTKLGICVADNEGRILTAGDAKDYFTIQSIAKILTFTCSLLDSGSEKVSQKVSVEPTDDTFNSIINLETKNNNKPLNPMINAGSIACLTLVKGKTPKQKFERILAFAKKLAQNDEIVIDESVYRSEKKSASRNRALTYYMISTGIIDEDTDVEGLLDAYFKICSISATCVDLARIALVYANNGVNRISGTAYFSKNVAQVIKATMVLCGMYDESGKVSVRIGLPTKSGVGGGILSLIPERMGIGIFGPALNPKGSSIAGLELLEMLSHHLDASIF